MTVKYKVSDFAKDLNISAKKVLDELAAMGSTGKKNSSTLEENELNYLLEKFSSFSSRLELFFLPVLPMAFSSSRTFLAETFRSFAKSLTLYFTIIRSYPPHF